MGLRKCRCRRILNEDENLQRRRWKREIWSWRMIRSTWRGVKGRNGKEQAGNKELLIPNFVGFSWVTCWANTMEVDIWSVIIELVHSKIDVKGRERIWTLFEWWESLDCSWQMELQGVKMSKRITESEAAGDLAGPPGSIGLFHGPRWSIILRLIKLKLKEWVLIMKWITRDNSFTPLLAQWLCLSTLSSLWPPPVSHSSGVKSLYCKLIANYAYLEQQVSFFDYCSTLFSQICYYLSLE